jgi:multimeric flavodoxin WrbA
MRMLGIVGSPRKGGNTEILVREALKAASEEGWETEIFLASEKQVAPCKACGTCHKEGTCSIKDDMQELYAQMGRADAIIIGSPVYFGNVSAQTKAIMDRTFSLLRSQGLRDKVAGAVVAVRRVGGNQVRSMLYSFFIAHKMIVAGGSIGYGREKGDVLQGVGGAINLSALEEAKQVGVNMVRLANRLIKSNL